MTPQPQPHSCRTCSDFETCGITNDETSCWKPRPAPSPDDEVCRYWGKKDGKPVCSLLIPDPALYVELVSADHKAACKQAADQAREDAMVEIVEELHRQFIGRTKSQILDIMCECQNNPVEWLESLRTGGEPR